MRISCKYGILCIHDNKSKEVFLWRGRKQPRSWKQS
nr:MAG TPA: hypothetical protein [Caudoviricetes sp.]